MSRQSTIVLGLGALSLAGLILYLAVLKKKKSGNAKPIKPDTDEPTLEFSVTNEAVPFIVGKNEEILRSIEQATGTRIQFKEQDAKHQLCIVRGSDLNAIQSAQLMIKEKGSKPPKVVELMKVPSTAANRIIGLCGEALEELCNTTKAKVWVNRAEDGSGVDEVHMEGTQAEINAAKLRIEQKVKEDREILKNQKVDVTPASPAPPVPVKTSPARITETPEPREVHPPKAETLSPNNSFGQLEVYVSAVAHPSKFFVQMVGSQSVELDLLIDAMSEYYNDEENREKHLISNPTVGQMVAAKFSEDEKWYRAEIVAIQDNAFGDGIVCDLFYVDYGDNQYVFPKDVYALKKDFLGLKYQAMECFLAYVKPNNPDSPNSWPQKANDRFDDLTKVASWKKLLLNIVTYRPGVAKSNQIPGVELFDIEDGRDINIGQQLIAEGLALPSTTGYFGDLVKSSVLKLEPETTTIDLTTDDSSKDTSSFLDSTNGNDSVLDVTDDSSKFNNNSTKDATPTKKDPSAATLDFLSGERDSHINGNNQVTTGETEPRQVKQWSDLLKED